MCASELEHSAEDVALFDRIRYIVDYALGPDGPQTGQASSTLQFRYEGALMQIRRILLETHNDGSVSDIPAHNNEST